MIKQLPPLYFIKDEYECMCGGRVAAKQINFNDARWVCTSCEEYDIVDISEYPEHFVVRKEKVNKTYNIEELETLLKEYEESLDKFPEEIYVSERDDWHFSTKRFIMWLKEKENAH